jgi:hypothetical protein
MQHLLWIKFLLLLEVRTESQSALECKLNTVCCCVPAVTVFILMPYSKFQNSLTVLEKPKGKFVFAESDPIAKLVEN